MKNSFCILLITFILNIFQFSYVFSQCSDKMVYDFSGGFVFTQRMCSSSDLKNYEQILNYWESKSQKWIDPTDFINNEINIFQKDLHHYTPQDSLSNCFSIIHDKTNTNRYKILYEIFLLKKDTLPFLISSFLIHDSSSMIRRNCADFLKYYSLDEVSELLKTLSIDPCAYVRLESALSLSYLGEKNISYNVFCDIWKENDPYINLDHFPYFTVGMRNIGNEKAVEFLKTLTLGDNPYCAIDASICLLQLKKDNECINGIKNVFRKGNSRLFFNGALILFKYYPGEVVKRELDPFLNDSDKNVAKFSEFIISSLQSK